MGVWAEGLAKGMGAKPPYFYRNLKVARYEHLPIFQRAYDLTLLIFSRCRMGKVRCAHLGPPGMVMGTLHLPYPTGRIFMVIN